MDVSQNNSFDIIAAVSDSILVDGSASSMSDDTSYLLSNNHSISLSTSSLEMRSFDTSNSDISVIENVQVFSSNGIASERNVEMNERLILNKGVVKEYKDALDYARKSTQVEEEYLAILKKVVATEWDAVILRKLKNVRIAAEKRAGGKTMMSLIKTKVEKFTPLEVKHVRASIAKETARSRLVTGERKNVPVPNSILTKDQYEFLKSLLEGSKKIDENVETCSVIAGILKVLCDQKKKCDARQKADLEAIFGKLEQIRRESIQGLHACILKSLLGVENMREAIDSLKGYLREKLEKCEYHKDDLEKMACECKEMAKNPECEKLLQEYNRLMGKFETNQKYLDYVSNEQNDFYPSRQ